MRRLMERQRRALASHDAGFTLVELIVAMLVIGVVLLALVGLQTSALVTITHAKQREQATAVANRVLEQLRAMPWTTLSKGMSDSYAVTGPDPNVSGGYLQASAQPPIHEVLKTSTSQGTAVAPLSGTGGTNVTDIQDPAAPGITFKARTYVTTPSPTTLFVGVPPMLQLTVIVTWTEVSGGHQQSIIARTEVYSPAGGCGQSETQPFLGACEAQLSAEAAALPATISVMGADPTGAGDPALPVLPGSGVFSASISLGSTSATTSSQQATTTVATTTYPGAATASASAALGATGGTSTRAGASSDTGAANVDPANSGPTSSAGSAGWVSATGTDSMLTLTPPATGVNGSVTAATTQGCTGVAGANQPCSNAKAYGSASDATLKFTAGGGTIFQLASVAAAPTESAWSGRYSTPNSSGGPGCTAVSGAGCVTAGATRSAMAATIGPLSGGLTNGLVQVTGYTDSVSGQLGPSQPNVDPTRTRSATTLSYWTGSSYLSLPPISTASNFHIFGDTTYTASMPPGRLTMSWPTADGSTVTAVGSITVKPAVWAWVLTDAQCVTTACRLTVSQPSVTVSVVYHVVNAIGGVDYSFIVTTDLGSVRSAVEYKAAPHV